jgi:hypothetical protein
LPLQPKVQKNISTLSSLASAKTGKPIRGSV